MKMNLDRTWVVNGNFYGPGEVDVSDEVADRLKARGADVKQAEAEEALQTEADQPGADELYVAGLSDEQNEALREAGYTSNEQLRQASDEELIGHQRIGRSTVKRIREALGSEAG